MRLTQRQTNVLENISQVTTDGARYNPQYSLNGTNVSLQVRALLDNKLIVLRDGKIELSTGRDMAAQPSGLNTKGAVAAMRAFLDPS